MNASLISVKEAQKKIGDSSITLRQENISIHDAIGRVLAEDIMADRNYPPFNRSAVDGFAINHSDLEHTTEFIIIEEVHAGSFASKIITKGTAIKIMTGAPVPPSATCVIKVEDCTIYKNSVHFKISEAKEGMNIAKEGEDLKKGEIAIPANSRINPIALGILAALGKAKIQVYNNPSVAIVSTGNEIKSIDDDVLPHQIHDSNSYSLEGFFKNLSNSNYRKKNNTR